MRKLSLVFYILVLISGLKAQNIAPYINYQGVARNSAGVPLVGNIGVEINIHQGNQNGTVVFTEPHSVTTNSFGVFNLLIGSQNQTGFNNIQWGQGPYFIRVSIDPLGGTAYSSVTVQPFASVPYALYAKDAANVKEFVAGANISISAPSSGNTYTINSSASSSSNATISVLPTSHQISSTGNVHQLTIASPSFANNTNAVSMGGSFPNYSLNYQYPTLSVTGNSILSISQGSYTSPAITLTSNASGGPWSTTLSNVYLSTGLNNVGIGTSTPGAKLDVISTASNVINATTTGNGNVINALTTGTGLGVYSSAANGAAFLGVNSSNIGAAVQANNSGSAESLYAYKVNAQTGSVAKFENLSAANTATTVVIGTNANNVALSVNAGGANAIVANSNGGTPSIYAVNSGAGSAIEAQNTSGGASLSAYKSSANGSAAIFNNLSNSNISPVVNVNNSNSTGGTAINVTHTAGVGVNVVTNGSGNVINASTSGGGIALNVTAAGNSAIVSNNNSNTNPSIFGNNSGQGNGIHGVTSSSLASVNGVQGTNNGGGSGVYGQTSGGSGFAAGVYGLSNGDLPAMLARNVWGSTAVTASGIRAITNSSSTGAAGVHGENLGTGPAVKASLTTFTVAGGLNAALLVENGHIKAMGAAPTLTTYTFNGFTGGVIGFGGSLMSANDVKGTVTFYTPNSFTGVIANAFIEQTIAFAKPYNIIPTVVVTPQVDLLNFEYLVKNISQTGFTIRIYRSSNSLLPTTAIQNYEFKFNYIVIE